ncbi:GIY-YIG nuclease family protein [candidate division KSB1 bacterium]|nr:MAG: GIY-YIG nuclease family protein [candidate division KSB1 bacterium]
MSFFVYILLSQGHERTYVGQTEDVLKRLARHNAGFVKSTKAWRPWILLHEESFATRSEAMKREEWFKTVHGRKFISRLIRERWEGSGLSDPALRDRDLAPTLSERTKPL